ncbi:hypothetical protein EUGRSUZ_D01489 [Eucalyptus grandis]|uniref:MATH domain-containing protein n=2 Tax=Eucalyptus grandis TaxID=71139 RepID=A0A059CFX1_EUCGR|nr:hypothetical protein EUGRSUZ_D01489 [Eucalyptus grandis]
MAMGCPAKVREPAKYERARPPAHYSFKIESFEVISTLDKYDSGVFEAGGYKWRLSLYPKGKKEDDWKYISLYLSIEKLPHNETVHVDYKLFVRDKSRNKYLTVQDADESSFQSSNTQRGFPRFLLLKDFKDPSNGYLDRNNSCTFGAEVFVIQPTKMKESLTLIRYPLQNTFTFKIENWSKLGTDRRSKEFLFEGRKWKLMVYPKGNAANKGEWLSVYLEVQDLTEKMKVYAEFNLRVLDQLNNNNKEKRFKGWLSASHPREGNAEFVPLKDIEKSANGFVQNDTLVVEVQISVISKVVGV